MMATHIDIDIDIDMEMDSSNSNNSNNSNSNNSNNSNKSNNTSRRSSTASSFSASSGSSGGWGSGSGKHGNNSDKDPNKKPLPMIAEFPYTKYLKNDYFKPCTGCQGIFNRSSTSNNGQQYGVTVKKCIENKWNTKDHQDALMKMKRHTESYSIAATRDMNKDISQHQKKEMFNQLTKVITDPTSTLQEIKKSLLLLHEKWSASSSSSSSLLLSRKVRKKMNKGQKGNSSANIKNHFYDILTDVNMRAENHDATLLHIAFFYQSNLDVIKYLLSDEIWGELRNVNIMKNIKDKNGMTLLHYVCAFQDNLEIIEYVLSDKVWGTMKVKKDHEKKTEELEKKGRKKLRNQFEENENEMIHNDSLQNNTNGKNETTETTFKVNRYLLFEGVLEDRQLLDAINNDMVKNDFKQDKAFLEYESIPPGGLLIAIDNSKRYKKILDNFVDKDNDMMGLQDFDNNDPDSFRYACGRITILRHRPKNRMRILLEAKLN